MGFRARRLRLDRAEGEEGRSSRQGAYSSIKSSIITVTLPSLGPVCLERLHGRRASRAAGQSRGPLRRPRHLRPRRSAGVRPRAGRRGAPDAGRGAGHGGSQPGAVGLRLLPPRRSRQGRHFQRRLSRGDGGPYAFDRRRVYTRSRVVASRYYAQLSAPCSPSRRSAPIRRCGFLTILANSQPRFPHQSRGRFNLIQRRIPAQADPHRPIRRLAANPHGLQHVRRLNRPGGAGRTRAKH